jgi:NTP pyrophosphatase (non-canonical NTP hydrolase)
MSGGFVNQSPESIGFRGEDFREKGFDLRYFQTRIGILVEELAEAGQVAGKVLRFGTLNFHPDDDERTPNRELLERELGDVLAIINLMADYDDVDLRAVYSYSDAKIKKLVGMTAKADAEEG